LAILLLTWVSTGTSLGRPLLAILTWWRWLLAIALLRCTRLTRRSAVTLGWLLAVALRWLLAITLRRLLAIALGWLLAVALGWLLTIALGWRAVLARRCAVSARGWVGLLVF
jgi:hypothetical protein